MGLDMVELFAQVTHKLPKLLVSLSSSLNAFPLSITLARNGVVIDSHVAHTDRCLSLLLLNCDRLKRLVQFLKDG